MKHLQKEAVTLRVFVCIAGFTLLLFICGIVASMHAAGERLPRCLIVASYHDEFPGQALKIMGARSVLEGKCEIEQFNMDTKRHPEPEFCENKAHEANALIESWRPDIVIAIDDNASKYLVQPYLKDIALPVVFSGIDWTADEYGYPYSNATGMIEVFPIHPLLKQITRILPEATRAVCLRGERLSEKKDCARYKQVYQSVEIDVVDSPVHTFEEFQNAFLDVQHVDVIIVQNYSGIEGWENEKAKAFLLENARALTVSQLDWMAEFTMLAITQVIEEQGQYAAEVALKLLAGAKPADFPVIANRQWNLYVNQPLLEKAGIELPRDLLRKAVKVQ
jgi:ABC-type uncharacterized transport system substrate-binding protein